MSNRPSTQATDEDLRLDVETRTKLLAVVVDANSYGKVGPDLPRLASLAADLAKIDVQVWVPEPVAWEWAEHLAAQWVAARNVVNDQLSHLSRAGLPASSINPSYLSREDLISKFLSVLTDTPHVKVVELTGASAIEGLKDQVLQRKPAKTKSADLVKTGGSDSAWLRDVVAKAGEPDRVMFLSKDADIKSAYAAWGYGQPLVREANTVRASLFEYVFASIDEEWMIARYLADQLPLNLDDATKSDAVQLVGTTVDVLEAVDLDWEHHGLISASLTKLTKLAGLWWVEREAPERHEPGRAPKRMVFRAIALFLAEAEITDIYSLTGGDTAGERTLNSDQLIARTRLMVTVENGKIVKVEPDSETVVSNSSPRSDHNWEAGNELADALEGVTGLELPSGHLGGWNVAEEEVLVKGTTQQVRLSWSHHNEGELWISVGTDEAHVTCEYDANAWIGGKEGMYGESPYFLRVETEHDIERGPWALAAWVFNRLLDSSDTESE
ncbi:hypothetical protein SAMN04488564_1179 [Lentzea waywayandensis]|uniref:Uncharacterized protein n=1 Tax=Lentzea waywayandensis TaxID=84724 RepID=A0A1I6FGN4_9PSEU|nr:hypothetical protein [Lentzea waywayandensis]SFR29085.1 hypothetical protein SAMN04488564_1179 [Lentzea waywayandensis]